MVIEHTFLGKDGLETKTLTKAKGIRNKCLDCCTYNAAEVGRCMIVECALYPFRFGNEKGLERIWTQEMDDEFRKLNPQEHEEDELEEEIEETSEEMETEAEDDDEFDDIIWDDDED